MPLERRHDQRTLRRRRYLLLSVNKDPCRHFQGHSSNLLDDVLVAGLARGVNSFQIRCVSCQSATTSNDANVSRAALSHLVVKRGDARRNYSVTSGHCPSTVDLYTLTATHVQTQVATPMSDWKLQEGNQLRCTYLDLLFSPPAELLLHHYT